MVVLLRAGIYVTLFAGLVLVFVPARVVSWSGIVAPSRIGAPQLAGMILAAAGATLAAWCVLAFARVGRGTPAPFDPPRRLVTAGPYRVVRNPMYIGAGLAVAGAALFYQSLHLLGYTGMFAGLAHLFVVLYEEPALRRSFGHEYEAYCRRVNRWRPAR